MKSRILTLASGAKTESANGTAYPSGGFSRMAALFNLTNADTDAGDTLDVYIDFSIDGSTWYNGCHFTQAIGTSSAFKELAIFDTANPGTSVFNVSTDASAGDQRPYMLGAQVRARWAIVDSGTDNASFTFSVTLIGNEG